MAIIFFLVLTVLIASGHGTITHHLISITGTQVAKFFNLIVFFSILGEPVNREERDVERDCLGIDIAFGFWFALNCYGNHPFVCQTRSLSSITTDTPPSTTVQTHKCSQNGQLSPNGQSCWYVQNKTADFVNAEMTCTRNFNGHLASIHSIFDNIKLTGNSSPNVQLSYC